MTISTPTREKGEERDSREDVDHVPNGQERIKVLLGDEDIAIGHRLGRESRELRVDASEHTSVVDRHRIEFEVFDGVLERSSRVQRLLAISRHRREGRVGPASLER